MSTFQLHIDADSAEDLTTGILALAAKMGAVGVAAPAAAPAKAARAAKAKEAPPAPTDEAPEPQPEAESGTVITTIPPQYEAPAAATPKAATPVITKEATSKLLLEVVRKFGKPACMQIITAHGETSLTATDPKHYPSIYSAAATMLGAAA